MKAKIQLETLSCPSCIQKIEGAVKSVPGVIKDSVKIMFNASKVKVDFDEQTTEIEAIHSAIQNMGYEVISSKVK
ncbi:heavy-metal-associated domain-containing protein [Macrococcoides caseolyticum]|uniref:heavy-metal-associated domain-containing protein n=1 Tax=Macrococcoides caseolyticum TaxID=69966 RepID=UPI001F329F2D|nr:heavy-metal-associated domain-containing protein [Macrococcus caseolyticus]MCE4957368.1 heavy-metal-associated domain-containing protein [Macrococcus caseolyticus]